MPRFVCSQCCCRCMSTFVYLILRQMSTRVYLQNRTLKTAKVHHRNAATTREAILVSARRAFARAGYDGAGVREIAKGAGVTAMMVNRYFGSKEQLFAEVVGEVMARPTILTRQTLESPTLGEDIAAALIDITK